MSNYFLNSQKLKKLKSTNQYIVAAKLYFAIDQMKDQSNYLLGALTHFNFVVQFYIFSVVLNGG